MVSRGIDQFRFGGKMGVNGLFGNTEFIGNIIHGDAFKPVIQKHLNRYFYNLFSHFSEKFGAKVSQETLKTKKVSIVLITTRNFCDIFVSRPV